MNNKQDTITFPSRGLCQNESEKLTELYLILKDWSAVKDKAIAENLLQARTTSTSRRSCIELISRLETLKESEIDLLIHGNVQEKDYLLWLAVCRRYQFIADFAVEVVREFFISQKTELSRDEFFAFFNRKSDWHTELDKASTLRRTKVARVVFQLLREAGLLNAKNIIQAALLSRRLLEVISSINRQDLLFFPAFEADLKGLA